MKKLSIIIPAYNEINTIGKIIEKINEVDLPVEKELVVVDDGSKDGTREYLAKNHKNLVLILHEQNKGKGSAIRTGLEHATGDYVVIQDADLEYDPNDFIDMVNCVQRNDADVVYGSRRLKSKLKKNTPGSPLFYLGGIYLTFLTNILYGTHITDEPTCYKMFRTSLIRSLNLVCTRFEFCPEVTAKVAKKGLRIYEVPISYYPRSVEEGKKIKFKDAVEATVVLLRNRFVL